MRSKNDTLVKTVALVIMLALAVFVGLMLTGALPTVVMGYSFIGLMGVLFTVIALGLATA